MLDILHCAVKQQQQSSSPHTSNLACRHSLHREIHLRDPYNNGSRLGPDHQSREKIQFKEHTLIHSLSSLFILSFLQLFSIISPSDRQEIIQKKELNILQPMFSCLGFWTEQEILILIQWSWISIKLQTLSLELFDHIQCLICT